jgi:uncharacterized protein YecE (DUF72 family)
MIKVGCCGFPVSKSKYFDNFNLVEIQQTFYQPPDISIVQKWRNEAPKNFEYTLKAWQLITHEPKSPTYRKLKLKIPHSKEKNYGLFKPTDEVLHAWEKTKEIANMLNAKIIVFQCPASFKPTEENKHNMKKFFSLIERGRFIFGWEPRGKWDDKEIETMCRELDLIHIVDPFKSTPVYGNIRYYRLHGIGGYKYNYTEADLRKLGDLIEGRRYIYFLFNNVFMYEDALEFKKICSI